MRGPCVAGVLLAASVATGSAHAADADKPWFDWDLNGVFIADGAWLDGLMERSTLAHDWRNRRTTLEATLEFGDDVDLVLDGGYNDEDPFAWRDAYVDYNIPGPYRLRVGLMKPEFGYSYSASLRNLITPERTLALDLLQLDRAPGLMATFSPGDHLLELGWYEDEDEEGETIHSSVLRYVYAHEGESLYWQGGASLAHSDYDGADFRIRTRGETRLMDNFLRTERITTEAADYAALEGVLQRGRALLQGELLVTKVDSPRERNRNFEGGYLQVSYFLTDDAHRFDNGLPQRLAPRDDHAVELVATASRLDAWSQENGFEAVTFGVGINYYYGRHLKVMLETHRLDMRRGRYNGEDGQAVQVRMQYRF